MLQLYHAMHFQLSQNALQGRLSQAYSRAPESFHNLAMKVEDRGPLTAEVEDGNNNYVWDDNSEYFGEWEQGQAHGRGVFSWPNCESTLLCMHRA